MSTMMTIEEIPATWSLAKVQELYDLGMISQEAYEEFYREWKESTFRYGSN